MAERVEPRWIEKVPKKAVAFGIPVPFLFLTIYGVYLIVRVVPRRPGLTRGLASEVPLYLAEPAAISLSLPQLITIGSTLVLALLGYIGLQTYRAIRDREDKWVAERQAHDEKVANEIKGLQLAQAAMKLELLTAIRDQFKDYVTSSSFRDYMEAHAREEKLRTEEFQKFMTRHWDWKDQVDPLLREYGANIADIREDLAEIRKANGKL